MAKQRVSQTNVKIMVITFLSRNSCFVFRITAKTESHNGTFVWLSIWPFRFWDFYRSYWGFVVFLWNFNDNFQMEDWFSLRQQMPVMTLPRWVVLKISVRQVRLSFPSLRCLVSRYSWLFSLGTKLAMGRPAVMLGNKMKVNNETYFPCLVL